MVLISGGPGWLVAGRVLRPLELAYDAQRRFVANASHELRTPLTASRALPEMVLAHPGATTETFRQTCRDALEENEQQEQLIDALLGLAQGEQGVDPRDPVDLAGVVRDAPRAHQAEALARQLDLDVSLVSARVLGDRRLLVRLVSNLPLDLAPGDSGGLRVEVRFPPGRCRRARDRPAARLAAAAART
jgi:signal transduction histidine kinase